MDKIFYINIGDIMNFSEGMAKLEEKVQARARLRVKKYRLDNKKSQQEVADYLGIDISTYNKYEKGSRKSRGRRGLIYLE